MSSPLVEFREPGLARSVAKLLRLRLTILVNAFRRAKRRTKIAYLGAGLGLLTLLALLLAVSSALLMLLRSPLLAEYLGDTAPLLESFPSIVMSIAGLGVLLTSSGVLLQTLYLSGDMDFLMSSPLPIRAVFVAKMIQAVLPNFIILSVVVLPVLFGLGISSGYHFLYYPSVVVVLAAISLNAASLAGLLVLTVARFFPPRRVAEVIGFAIAIVIFTGSQLAGHMSFEAQQLAGMAPVLERFNHPLSPLAWAGRGLIEVGRCEWLSALGLLAACLALSGAVFCAALATSERLYYTGWASLQDNRRTSKNRSKARTVAAAGKAGRLARVVPAPVLAIVVKDIRLCVRDLSNLSGLLFPLILGVLWSVGLVRSQWQMPVGQGKAPPGFIQTGNAVFVYGDIALALFLGWMLVANLAGLAFTREGRNFWILKAAPVGPRPMLAAKFLVSYIPAALICSVYVLALEVLKRVDPGSILISLISVWMMVAGLSGIYLAFGTTGAKFDWENPAQRNRSVGCLGLLTGMIFMPVSFALFIAPAILAQMFHLPLIIGRVTGLLLGGAVNVLAVTASMALVERRVSTLNE